MKQFNISKPTPMVSVGNTPDLIDSLNATQEALHPVQKIKKSPIVNVVKNTYDDIIKSYETTIDKAISSGSFKNDDNLPVNSLAVFNAWRNGKIEVNDENAGNVLSALTTIASGGRIKDDYDGSVFMSFAQMTDNSNHKMKSGLSLTQDTNGIAKRKWNRKSTLDGFKKYFDALDAGEVGMRLSANKELLRRGIGMKDGEDYFSASHERQYEIACNAVPLYGDLTQFKNSIDGLMKEIGAGYIDCKDSEAGQYISSKILKDAKFDIVNQSESVKDFLNSGLPRTEENLAEWIETHKMKYLNKELNQVPFQNDQYGAIGMTKAIEAYGKDDISGFKDENGKWHLQYKLGGRYDREFALKNKVISDMADTDGRYNAIRAINILNENPEAWSFVRRWIDKMNGEVPVENRIETLARGHIEHGIDPTGLLVAQGNFFKPQVGKLQGDHIGVFDMMMDYLEKGNPNDEEYAKRRKVCNAAMQAFSCIDNRKGSYWSGKSSVGQALAGFENAVQSGAFDFWRGLGDWTVGLFGDDIDYAANYASKFTTEDKALVELRAKTLMEGLSLVNSNEYFSDNTILGGAAEFLISLEAMGPLFGASTKAVGGATAIAGKGISKARVLGKILHAPWLGKTLTKSGAFTEKMGKWLVAGGMSPAQQKISNEFDTLFANSLKAEIKGEKVLESSIERMKTLESMLSKITTDPQAYISFSDKVAQFISKIPAGVYFYDEAKHASVGTYVLSTEDTSEESLKNMEYFGNVNGVIEGLMMAGLTHLAKGNKSIISEVVKNLRGEAKALDRQLKAIVDGTVVPEGRDAAKTLCRKAVLMRAFEMSRNAFKSNAEFMFTLEEAKNIVENTRLVCNDLMKDPNYRPSVYEMVGRGQAEALAETAKIASTAAISTLTIGGAKTATKGGLSKDAVQKIANSRGTLLQERLTKEGFNGRALITDFALKYSEADDKTRKLMRNEIRSRYSEETARLFDQFAYEIERPRADQGIDVRSNIGRMREQKLTKEGISESLARIGVKNVKVEAMPNGSVYLTMPKGTKIGDYEVAEDKTFVVKASSMEGLHSKTVDGKKVYDLNWIDEIISKHLSGQNIGEFSKKLDEFLGRQMSEGQKEKKLARLRNGENIEGLLDVMEKSATDQGIYIPKGDTRYGKSMEGEDVNLADGVILLANANAAGRIPAAGTNGIIDAALARGADVETFLHEYFHAVTDSLPFTPEQKKILQERYGKFVDADGKTQTQNWKEGLVDAFIKAHFEDDRMLRGEAFRKLNDGGVLTVVQEAAKLFARSIGLDAESAYSDNRIDKEVEAQSLNDFIGDMLGEVRDTKKETDAQNEAKNLAREITGSSFKVDTKNTSSVLESFRGRVRSEGGFGKNPKHYEYIRGVAKSWMNGTADMTRYPEWIAPFGKDDAMLAQSLCAASLNSINDSQTKDGYTSLISRINRSGISQAEMSIIARKFGVIHKGMDGYDPSHCFSYGGGAGYVKFDENVIDTFNVAARDEQKKTVVDWAKKNDCYYSDITKLMDDTGRKLKPIGFGAESEVWKDARHGKVVKHLAGQEMTAANDISTMLDRIVLFNSIFPEAKMKVIGWGEEVHHDQITGEPTDKRFGVFVEQPYLVGDSNLSEAEVADYMKSKGFRAVYDIEKGDNMYVSDDNSVVIRDINQGNAVRYIDGQIGVIDAICALNTKQNVRDGVVQSSDLIDGGDFKDGTWKACWDTSGVDVSILDRLKEEKRNLGATDVPETGKPYIALGFHGTRSGGFTVFDPKMSDDKLTLFMAGTDKLASLLAKGSEGAKGIYNLAIRFDNPLVIDAKGSTKKISDNKATICQLAKMASEQGYDGVIVQNCTDDGGRNNLGVDADTIYIQFIPEHVKMIDDITFDDYGNMIPVSERLNFDKNESRWNVVGERALTNILGAEEAGKQAKTIRETFREAFNALESDESRDSRKRIENDEINAFLESRGNNEFTVDFNGSPVKFKFYKGGADGKTRIEYGGQSAIVPRYFQKRINELNDKEEFENLYVSDFYKKDEVMNSSIFAGVHNARVFVKGTNAYKKYVKMREIEEKERLKSQGANRDVDLMSRIRPIDPIFVNGVGVNEYGDVIIEKLGDNRTIAKQMNQAVVKLMQKFEGWETPVTYSNEYFGYVIGKREMDMDGTLSFVMGDKKLAGMIEDIVRTRLEEVNRGREIKGLDTDDNIIVEKVRDAMCEAIGDCARYFNSEIEAVSLGERFGKDIDTLPKYSELQRDVINGLIRPYNHNNLKSWQNSRNVVKFYRDVVMKLITNELFNRTDGTFLANAKNELSHELSVKVRNYIRDTVKGYVDAMPEIEEARVNRDNLGVAKEYEQGALRGSGAKYIVSDAGNVAEKAEAKLDKATRFEAGAMKLAEDFIKENGVNALLGNKDIIKKMFDAVKEAMGNEAEYYKDIEIMAKVKDSMLKAVSNAAAQFHVKTSDGSVLDGGLLDQNRKLKRDNKRLQKRVDNAVKNRMQATRIRNAAGMTSEEIDSYFGRDTIGDLVNIGIDPTAPILNAGKFANEMTVNFAIAMRDAHKEFRDMKISEFFDNPIASAEYAATVASWLNRAARKCAYGRVRSAIQRDAAQLRWLVKPSFFTAKNILTDSVRKMVELQSRMKTKTIIENIKNVIDKKALGSKVVKQNEEAYDRDVSPLVQEYWKSVKDCLEMTQEDVDAELNNLQNEFNFGETEWDEIRGTGSEGLKSLTEDQVKKRRAALIRAVALTRYGALKYKSIGELGDKVDEISNDITTHRERFAEMFSERIERDKRDVATLVDQLTKARANTTGATNIAISKGRAFLRGALYYNLPDLFLKLKAYFPKNSEAYNLCEEFRRDMSLAHIDQEQMISSANDSFVSAIQEIYGKEFHDVINELMTPSVEYAKFARSDWAIPVDALEQSIFVNGKEKKFKGAVMGGNPNATRSANGLSKAQLMYIYAACSQEDMMVNNAVYKRDAAYFREIADIIGPEGLAVIKWMREQFDLQRKAMSPICEAITGMPVVSPNDNYFSLKFEQAKDDPMDKRTRFSPNMFPSFLTNRKNHDGARLEERIDIFHMFHERMQDTAHYCTFMPIIDRVRTTFSNREVQTAYAKTIGEEAYKEMYTQLSTALNGGKSDTIKWLAGLRNFTTASTLFYNIPSAIKQFEGIGGWSAEMGVTHWLKNIAAFNYGSREARDCAASIDMVLDTRKREGFSDVARALKESIDAVESGHGTIRETYNKYKRHGLRLTEFIDRLASRSMAGAYFNQKVAYYRSMGDNIDDARQKALADVDYAIQTTQQSSRPEFQISAQRGDSFAGEFGKLFSQFAGPAYMRLGLELEALHRYIITRNDGNATKQDIAEARKAFIGKAVALHIICPSILTALECFGKSITHNPDDEDFLVECMNSWARNVLTGPFSGAFVLGSLAENAAHTLLGGRGTVKRFNVPMLSRLESLYKRTSNVFNDLRLACMGDLDGESLLRYTLDVIEALAPAARHVENATINIPNLLK